MAQFREIPIQDITFAVQNARDQPDTKSEDYLTLRENVRRFGILQPVTVRMEEDPVTGEEVPVLDDGRHRIQCAMDLGIPIIPCMILEGVEDVDRLATQMAGNTNVPMTDSQVAKAAKVIMQKYGYTLAQTAREIGRPERQVKALLGLNNLPDKIGGLVDAGKVPVQSIVALKDIPPDHLDEWVLKAIQLPPSKFVPEAVEFVKDLKAQRTGEPRVVIEEVFDPKPRLRKLLEVRELLDQFAEGTPEEVGLLLRLAGVSQDGPGGFKEGLKWVLSLDGVSIESERALFEQTQERRRASAQRRESEKSGA